MSFFSRPAAPPPPPPPPKRKIGCCGCGCVILALLAVLLLGLVGGGGYLAYAEIRVLTSADAATIPTFDGGDDMYNAAMQKLTAFNHDLKDHQAATIHLSGDEINTLIARDPALAKKNIRLFVTFSDSAARIQSSVPTEDLTWDMLKMRYLNGDTSFNINFDPAVKTLNLDLISVQIGETNIPKDNLPLFQTEINGALNGVLQSDPDAKNLLQQAKSIQIVDNELVIETE